MGKDKAMSIDEVSDIIFKEKTWRKLYTKALGEHI